jgi:hypothetical protein
MADQFRSTELHDRFTAAAPAHFKAVYLRLFPTLVRFPLIHHHAHLNHQVHPFAAVSVLCLFYFHFFVFVFALQSKQSPPSLPLFFSSSLSLVSLADRPLCTVSHTLPDSQSTSLFKTIVVAGNQAFWLVDSLFSARLAIIAIHFGQTDFNDRTDGFIGRSVTKASAANRINVITR